MVTRRQQCRHKDLLSKVGPKVKTSKRYDSGAHLREGVKRVTSRYDSMQQRSSLDYLKAVLKASKRRRGAHNWAFEACNEKKRRRGTSERFTGPQRG